MRKLNIYSLDKKIRGQRRYLRNLKIWSENFDGYFPDLEGNNQQYYNWKIPVPLLLLYGKHSSNAIKAECAQYLINACQYLILAKPQSLKYCKVTCFIALPNMFSSEICIHLNEDYFNSHTGSGLFLEDKRMISAEYSLKDHWNLNLPENIYEKSIHIEYLDPFDEDDNYIADHWYFIEK